MNEFNDALLILDWGIGGIGTFIEVRKKRPDLDILYWSDSGAMPYGTMTEAELSSRVLDVIQGASKLGASHTIIACNAASTILPFIASPIPTIGVIEKGVEKLIHAYEDKSQTHIGIIGGKRTIDSGAWSQPLINEGFRVSSRIAQPLSAIIEAGKQFDPDIIPVFEAVLAGLEEVTDLVLACTHYVAAVDVISTILPNARLFDPVDEAVNFVIENWAMRGAGGTCFLTTGNVLEMEKAAKLAFGLNIDGRARRATKI